MHYNYNVSYNGKDITLDNSKITVNNGSSNWYAYFKIEAKFGNWVYRDYKYILFRYGCALNNMSPK